MVQEGLGAGTHSWRINEMGRKGDEVTSTLTRLSQRMSLKKAEFCEATPGTDSYLLGSSHLPLYGEPVAARVGLLKRVETVIECRNWVIASSTIAVGVLPGRAPDPILPPGQLSLSVKCHAAFFSTSPRRRPPRLRLSGQPRVPTPELGPIRI